MKKFIFVIITFGFLGVHISYAGFTDNGDGTCSPTGFGDGQWWAATGSSDGVEPWLLDLSPFAGQTVEISIAYVSDYVRELDGVVIDDILVSTGEGSTSFEADDDPLDGW